MSTLQTDPNDDDRIKLDNLCDFIQMLGKSCCYPKVIKNMSYVAISWIPMYLFFTKIYYPLIYKQFIKIITSNNDSKIYINLPKMETLISSKSSGIATMHLFSMIHAIFSVISTAKSWIRNKYKSADITNAILFDFPNDLRKSSDILIAYLIIDMIPTLYFTPKNFEAIAHHFFTFSFISLERYLNIGGPGHINLVFWAEISTIFLQPTWFIKDILSKFDEFILTINGRYNNGDRVSEFRRKIEKYVNILGVLFALIFLYSRWIHHFYLTPKVVTNIYNAKKIHNGTIKISKIAKYCLIFCALSFNFVSILWSYALIKLLLKLAMKKKIKLQKQFSN